MIPADENKKKKFSDAIGKRESRMLKAKRSKRNGAWFGLGMMGLVGWSVALPTLAGAGIGYWIDSRYPTGFSWTLMLLVGGLMVGSLNAWHWVEKEKKEIQKEEEEENE